MTMQLRGNGGRVALRSLPSLILLALLPRDDVSTLPKTLRGTYLGAYRYRRRRFALRAARLVAVALSLCFWAWSNGRLHVRASSEELREQRRDDSWFEREATKDYMAAHPFSAAELEAGRMDKRKRRLEWEGMKRKETER